jgi:hypothetical protein
MFARSYFQKYGNYLPLIAGEPHPDTTMFVMIPSFREPDVLATLDSLAACDPPRGIAEVFVIINEPETCDTGVSAMNAQTFHDVTGWIERHPQGRIRFHTAPVVKLPQKWAGVGMARKRGMDEALWRFQMLDRPNGIIVSLDADTLVEPHYLTSIEDHFMKHPTHVGATIDFSHQLDGISDKQREGILLYEKYLKYYKAALTWCGYPNALYTIGSAFAVTADGYMRRGGMTRRKAGEDFYFLQTLTQVGKVGEITSTAVHPSARESDRVAFGTGPSIKHWMEDTEDLRMTYNVQAFIDLKVLFSRHRELFLMDSIKLAAFPDELPLPLRKFFEEDGLLEAIANLQSNCASEEVFSTRFFHLFNAFKILKFVHFGHRGFYERQLLDQAHDELIRMIKA